MADDPQSDGQGLSTEDLVYVLGEQAATIIVLRRMLTREAAARQQLEAVVPEMEALRAELQRLDAIRLDYQATRTTPLTEADLKRMLDDAFPSEGGESPNEAGSV